MSTSTKNLAVKKIVITDQILTGNLFTESGYDEYASADNLADIFRATWTEQAAMEFPHAQVDIEIDIQRASGSSKSLEVWVEGEDGEDAADIDTETLSQYYQYIAEKSSENWDEWVVCV